MKNQKPPPFSKVRTKKTVFQDCVFLKRVLHTHISKIKRKVIKVTFIREL